MSLPTDLTNDVLGLLDASPGVSRILLLRGASVRPTGDVVEADIAREACDAVVGTTHDGCAPGGDHSPRPGAGLVVRCRP